MPDKFILPLFETLKPKEIVILQYLATGKPMKNIQDYTGISHSYATNVLAELRLRLGGINNDKLMYLFGLMKALMLFKTLSFLGQCENFHVASFYQIKHTELAFYVGTCSLCPISTNKCLFLIYSLAPLVEYSALI